MEITLGPPSTIRATTGTPWPIPAHKKEAAEPRGEEGKEKEQNRSYKCKDVRKGGVRKNKWQVIHYIRQTVLFLATRYKKTFVHTTLD